MESIEAWEGEVAPESAAAPEPAEERPSMLSRLASWRAPEPEPEMERDGKTEAPAPPEPAEEAPRQLHCDHFYCRAPPGPLGLAFKDSTRVVGGLLPPYTSVLCGTVYPGDELVSVNDCVVADDDFLGVLTAQDDGATARTLVFSRASCDDCKIWADSGTGGPSFAFFSAPTGSLFVTMGPGRPGQGDRRHSQPAGPFSHLIGSVEYFSPISDAARRRDGVKDACTAVFRVLCIAVLCVVCGGGGASGGAHR